MAARKFNPLRTGGHAWGKRRVALNLSIRQLEELSGVSRSTLSWAETGRINPTPEEFDKVDAALTAAEAAAGAGATL